ncbi:DUF1796 family putative cysteine peptidase [Aporhodopirellula aestuarii]|uniref:Papain-like cysteine peptidase n=1 Tax=Aporhodopirellula aestuarii TaxID=2950107 RepID=A0ABT0U5K8_9BACT|nr:DUF1796 family putative cysteine peptidase [Aporhodopirellula aestuarii]MCM2372211.1 papain-like cysteine peptidase [Aporhodopirellula aestuarii]
MRNQMVISLGGGCDIAMILGHYHLRHTSLPFDWLWNLHDGLDAVTSIIERDFEGIRGREAYTQSKHFRWPNQQSVVFKEHPHIAHVHNNPLEDQHALETLDRRIDRLAGILAEPQREIAFVYYRRFDEGPEALDDSAVEAGMVRLVNESRRFMEMVNRKFTRSKFRLLSVYSADEACVNDPSFADRFGQIAGANPLPELDFDYVVCRPENDRQANRKWQKQWANILLRHGVMSRVDVMKSVPLSTKRRLRQMLPRRFRRNQNRH